MYKTEQERFWSGKFGDDYIDRNKECNILAANIHFWARVLEKMDGLQSVIEFGSNIGLNLKAICHLIPNIDVAAIEINEKAVSIIKADPVLASGGVSKSLVNPF